MFYAFNNLNNKCIYTCITNVDEEYASSIGITVIESEEQYDDIANLIMVDGNIQKYNTPIETLVSERLDYMENKRSELHYGNITIGYNTYRCDIDTINKILITRSIIAANSSIYILTADSSNVEVDSAIIDQYLKIFSDRSKIIDDSYMDAVYNINLISNNYNNGSVSYEEAVSLLNGVEINGE